MLHRLIKCVCLLIIGGIVEFRSLKASSHEIYSLFIIMIILLSTHYSKRSIKREGVEKKIFVENWVIQSV